MNASSEDERLAILKMIENRQISAEEAVTLLDAVEPSLDMDTTLPEATVEEEAWMLTALLQVTEAISSPQATPDSLDDMLGRIVRIVPLLSGVDRCALYLDGNNGHSGVPVAHYPGGDASSIPALDLGMFHQVRAEAQPLIQSEAHCAHAVLPMAIQGKFLGAMQVEYVGGPHTFTSKETAILANIASQAAVGIENINLRQEAVERARLERELQLAHSVQSSLLPLAPPQLPGWQIAGSWQAARSVGGDFYDFIPLGRGRLGLVIADVAGKGMSAALFMALSRSIVRASVSHSHSAARSIEQANRLICADAHDGMFVTLLYAIIAAGEDAVAYTNAGHNPPFVVSHDGVQLLDRHGAALGIIETASLAEEHVPLSSGDVLVLYTDGLTEAINEQNEQFGLERLTRVVQEHRQEAPGAIIDQVMQAIAAFAGSQQAFDDATIVVARRM